MDRENPAIYVVNQYVPGEPFPAKSKMFHDLTKALDFYDEIVVNESVPMVDIVKYHEEHETIGITEFLGKAH